MGHNAKRVISLLAAILATSLLAGCYRSHPQSTFDTTGPVAQSQVTLFYIIFWAGLFVFIAVMAMLIYLVFRYRRRPNQGDPEQVHGNKRIEIAWTFAPAVVLIIIAVPTIITIFSNATSPTPPEEGGLLVEATGHQWFFEFRYPQHDVITANELHIPVGEVVNLQLHSIDVIHSFWVPKLAGKVDMIPNNDNTMWLKAEESGLYYGQCAEFCGISHANMRFKVIAEPKEEFDHWLQGQAAPAAEPSDPLAQEGMQIFMSSQAGCRGCHTIAGTKAQGKVGPSLTHFASRTTFAGGLMENNQANVAKWLQDPEELKPGNIMARNAAIYTDPERGLTEPQISALVAYLRGLK